MSKPSTMKVTAHRSSVTAGYPFRIRLPRPVLDPTSRCSICALMTGNDSSKIHDCRYSVLARVAQRHHVQSAIALGRGEVLLVREIRAVQRHAEAIVGQGNLDPRVQKTEGRLEN